MLKEKEKEKIEKYQDLKKGVTEDLECEDYTLVVRFLGAIPKQFGNRLKETGITAEKVQKTVLLARDRILRKVFDFERILLCVSSMILMMIIIIMIKILMIMMILIVIIMINSPFPSGNFSLELAKDVICILHKLEVKFTYRT